MQHGFAVFQSENKQKNIVQTNSKYKTTKGYFFYIFIYTGLRHLFIHI